MSQHWKNYPAAVLKAAPGQVELLAVPPAIELALAQGAALAISLSGGKDSQALLMLLAPWFRARGYAGQLFAIHADLGRAEWEQTPAFVQHLCDSAGVPLIIERRTKGDLVQRITAEAERTKQTGQQFWPSSGARYCTSDMKRGPIQRAQRRLGELVVCCQGLRADESAGRARQPVMEVERALTAKSLRALSAEEALAQRQPGQRVALNWRPLLHFTTAQVWAACGTSEVNLRARQRLHSIGATTSALAGWVGHPAYVLGNQRLSCALCVLGSKNDLLNGANHNPTTYGLYLELEVLGGSTFKHGQSLFDLPVSGRAAEVRDEILRRGEAAA